MRRLPARVYWFRRALVLGTAFAMVWGLAHVLGSGGGDPDSATPAASKLGRSTNPTPGNGGPLGPRPLSTGSASPTGTPHSAALAQPDGPCPLDEITVTPVVADQPAGSAVELTLQLTGVQPACTFEVSSKSLVAKVVHLDNRVWSSQQCRSSVPKQSVVVRSAQPTTVQLSWTGRWSDDRCSRATSWANPGTYRLVAAVVGSVPAEAEINLTTPPRAVITRTVHPKPKKKSTTATPATGH